MDDGLIQRAPMNAQNMQREISTVTAESPIGYEPTVRWRLEAPRVYVRTALVTEIGCNVTRCVRYKARSHTDKSNILLYTSFADSAQPRCTHGTLPVSLNAARFPA